MKPCLQYAPDLATAAALGETLSEPLSHHLQGCSRCRSTFAELVAAAQFHREAATHLPTPTKSPSLAPWLRNNLPSGKSESSNKILRTEFLRPAFLTAIAALFVVFLTVVMRPQKPHKQVTAINPVSTSSNGSVGLATPTWQALRKEVIRENDNILPSTSQLSGSSITHYRLKDAHSEIY